MSEKSNSLQIGMGSMVDVANELCNLPELEKCTIDKIREVCNAIYSLMDIEDGYKIMMPIVASLLNTDIIGSGRVWRIDTNGFLVYEFIGSIDIRMLICKLIQ